MSARGENAFAGKKRAEGGRKEKRKEKEKLEMIQFEIKVKMEGCKEREVEERLRKESGVSEERSKERWGGPCADVG